MAPAAVPSPDNTVTAAATNILFDGADNEAVKDLRQALQGFNAGEIVLEKTALGAHTGQEFYLARRNGKTYIKYTVNTSLENAVYTLLDRWGFHWYGPGQNWFVKPAADHLAFDAHYPTDDEQIPTGDLRPPPERPWDDCFVGPHPPLELVYPNGLRITVVSDCDHWVVYDRPPHATCLEPQSGPPDALNSGNARVVQPGEMLQRTMSVRWRRG